MIQGRFLMLLLWRPGKRPLPFIKAHPARVVSIATLYFIVSIPSALSMAGFAPATLTASGELVGESPIVVLEPDKWFGKRPPLLDHIDVGRELAEGEWIVVLYRHDCPKCQELIPEYQRIARSSLRPPDSRRVALIQMPPYDRGVALSVGRARHASSGI